MKLTPIDVAGDSAKLHEAVAQMFVRAAQMARKRPSPIDLAISPESVSLIVAMEDLFLEQTTVDEAIARIDRMFLPFGKLVKS